MKLELEYQSAEYRIQNTEYRMQNAEVRVSEYNYKQQYTVK